MNHRGISRKWKKKMRAEGAPEWYIAKMTSPTQPVRKPSKPPIQRSPRPVQHNQQTSRMWERVEKHPFISVWTNDLPKTPPVKPTPPPETQPVELKPFLNIDLVKRTYPFPNPNGVPEHTIYALVDPLKLTVRYIGYTSRALENRLRAHLMAPTNKLNRKWFNRLRHHSTKPLIVPIFQTTETQWEEDEIRLIMWIRYHGRLNNIDPGGNHKDRNGRVRLSNQQLVRKIRQQFQALNKPSAAVDLAQSTVT